MQTLCDDPTTLLDGPPGLIITRLIDALKLCGDKVIVAIAKWPSPAE